MNNERVKIKKQDLLEIATTSNQDDARYAIFLLNDFGLSAAIDIARSDGDKGLERTLTRINDARSDDGEDAVKLIDLFDELRML